MKLCAFDVETTGTDRENHQILEMGALVFDGVTGESFGEFERIVKWQQLNGDPYALALNSTIIGKIALGEGSTQYEALQDLSTFLGDHFPKRYEEAPIAVGFNVGSFDLAFLNRACEQGFPNSKPLFHYRTIELGTLLMSVADTPGPVSSKEAAKTLFSKERLVAHRALADCEFARECFMLTRRNR